MVDIIPIDQIVKKIYWLRGVKVMLDRDLAVLYDIETRILNAMCADTLNAFPMISCLSYHIKSLQV